MTSITTLPQSSRTILRSTAILTSIPQIIHELVQNSLDANASQIDISVNMDLWQCCVRDDGHGIEKTDMAVLAKGGEEGRYGSSKAHDEASLGFVSTLGFRGEAIASAADVSILEISSRTVLALDTWSIILKGGKPLYYGPATRWKRERAGTTVVVRDAFYNLPVRRQTHPNLTRTVELVRRDLECTALVFPHVVFSLENSAKEQNEGFGRGRILTIPKTNSPLATFRHLFGRTLCENFDEISIRESNICVEGFLGLKGIHTKLHQYLYVNRQLQSPCELHRIIDARLAASSFGRDASEIDASIPIRRAIRRSPRKNERRLVYFLSITLPSHLVDNCLDPAKTSVNVKNSAVLCELLDKVMHSFLIRHGFASSSRKRALDDSNDSSSKKPRTKKMVESFALIPLNMEPRCSQNMKPTPLTDPFCDRAEDARWADTATGCIYSVNLKTGNSCNVNRRHRKAAEDEHNDAENSQRLTYVDSARLKSNFTDWKTPEWIENTLAAWKNPTFGFEENGIRSLSIAASQDNHSYSQLWTRCFHRLPLGDEEFVATISTNFTKTQLKNAQVIGQVDSKFIACILEDTSSRTVGQTLILVDQHAADERVRVERFLSEICKGFLKHDSSIGIKVAQLDPPIPVLLNKFEAKIFRQDIHFQEAFARWGFKLGLATEVEPDNQDEEVDSTKEYSQVLVEEIPELLSEKLLTGSELKEFVKSYLARLAVEARTSNSPSLDSTSHWTRALRQCPRELVDLINSKACRGAIMFNDDLDLDQCQQLIFQLSRTVWPFMCAHGRPSLVPLTGVELVDDMQKKSIDWSKLKPDFEGTRLFA